MNATFEEKSVWIQLFSLLVVLGLYFVIATNMMLSGVNHIAAFVPLFVVAVILLVVVQVTAHVVAAIANKPESRDERDQLIKWRAESNASWILGVGVLAAIAGLVVSDETVWIAHLLLFSLLISEVVTLVFQIYYYQKGI